jgi:hypothetical protein
MAEPQPPHLLADRWLRRLPLTIVAGELALAALLLWGTKGSPLSIGSLFAKSKPPALINLLSSWSTMESSDATHYAAALRAQLTWQLSVAILLVLLAINLVATVSVTHDSLPESDRPLWARRCRVAAWVAGLAMVALVAIAPPGFEPAETVLHFLPPPAVRFVTAFVNAGNVVLLVVAPFLIATGASAVLHLPPCGAWEKARVLALHEARLNALLNLGAALLAAGTFEIWAFYSWPAAQMAAPGSAVFFSIAKTMSSVAGAFYSVVLASIYLPAVLVLRRALADEHVAPSAEAEADAKATWTRQLKPLLAMLTPFLAGAPAAEVLKFLAEKW